MRPCSAVPRWLIAAGVPVVAVSALLAARLVWEQTLLTWAHGPQMVGFALVHGYLAPLILTPFLLLVWLGLVAACWIHGRLQGRRLGRGEASLIAAALISGALPFVPYGAWQRLFAGRLATGPYASEFLIEAAALGDERTVRALLDHGVGVAARNGSGQTALHGAAVGNQPAMIALLADRGAALDVLDASGDSPLQAAVEVPSPDAVRELRARGARQIAGTAERHRKAIEEEVARDIGRMLQTNPNSP
jgi:hypothetical protein